MGTVEVISSKEGSVNAIAAEDGFAMLSEEEFKGITVEKKLLEAVEAPVRKGEKIGKVSVYTANGEQLFSTDIVAAENIKRHDFETSVKKLINMWLNSPTDGIL